MVIEEAIDFLKNNKGVWVSARDLVKLHGFSEKGAMRGLRSAYNWSKKFDSNIQREHREIDGIMVLCYRWIEL